MFVGFFPSKQKAKIKKKKIILIIKLLKQIELEGKLRELRDKLIPNASGFPSFISFVLKGKEKISTFNCFRFLFRFLIFELSLCFFFPSVFSPTNQQNERIDFFSLLFH